MIEVKVGNIVRYNGKDYLVEAFLSPTTILLKSQDESYISIKIDELDENPQLVPMDIIPEAIDEKLLKEAKRRYEIIKPILDSTITTKKEIEKWAQENNVSVSSIYRWLKSFKTTNTLASLIPNYENRGGKGKGRLPTEIEAIIDSMIKERYLSQQRISISKLHKEINAVLHANGYPTVTYNTVRNRINRLDERKLFRAREGKSAYDSRLEPASKNFEAQYPLQIVQIDHTQLDIQLVDGTYRKPIGRPHITYAIDIYSRMICGFYLTLDPPSFYSVGQTLYLALSPKKRYLEELQVEGEWNIQGVPNTIHVDNAQEFRGEQLRKVCDIFGINLDFRPKRKAKSGGHVERFIKTLNLEMHSLSGTTFSNPQDRREYDSEKKAVFTIKELERYLADWIVNFYHKKPHEGLLGKTPEQKLQEGILGDGKNPPAPLKILTKRELETARIALLPMEERTIQRTGVSLFGITYYDECLIPFMKAYVSDKRDKTYLFRYDPKDMSKIYFYHPELKDYVEIPYKNFNFPSVNLWEIKLAKQELKKQGEKYINEYKLFETIHRLREMEKEAAQKTKLHRRRQENKKSSVPLSKKMKEEIEELNKPKRKPKIKKFNVDFLDEEGS